MNLRDWTHRLRALVMPRRVERDLHDELSFHIERETKKLIDEGMEPARARNTAKARFGSTTVAADACRDERGTAFVDNTIRDVQYAMRTFRRGPLAAITIVVTVAIGLGVVAVLFTILNRFLFRVDTVPDISAMYGVERPRANSDRSLLTRPQFEALRKETRVFTDAYASLHDIDLRVDGQMMAVTLVSGNFFQVVGVRSVLGRALAPSDDERSGGNAVIVLSDKGWTRRFDRDPNVLGRTVVVNGLPFDIIGVMPEGFRGLEVSAPDFWAPLSLLAQFRPGDRGQEDSVGLDVVGRLRPGVAMESARAQLSAWESNQQVSAADRHTLTIDLVPRRGTLPQPMEAIARLCTVVLRVRIDPADRVRQRREPVARARRGASARDRHSTVAGRVATPHCAAVDDRELAARAGGGRRGLRGVAPHARRIRLLGDARHAGGSRRCEYQRARRGLARRNVSGGRRSCRHRVFRADAGAAGDTDRTGADAARRTGEGCAARPCPQRADWRAGLRIRTAPDLRRDLPSQCDRVVAIRSGLPHGRHRDDRARQRAKARRDACRRSRPNRRLRRMRLCGLACWTSARVLPIPAPARGTFPTSSCRARTSM